MKKVVWGMGALLTAGLLVAFTWNSGLAEGVFNAGAGEESSVDENAIKWYSWEEAIAAAEKQPKKLFVDVYTEWCGWCKRMDASTFTDPAVIKYMNANFYAVKLDAEQKGDIQYKGQKLVFRADAGRRGVHELAYSLLNGRMGYPSFVYLDEKQDRITISPGYKTPDILIKELKYVSEGHYKTKRFEDYQAEGGR